MIVTDYHGKVVEFTGNVGEALSAGYNVDCKNCDKCTACYQCENCFECARCHECKQCTRCMNVHKCYDCVECSLCDYCTSCRNCSSCVHCSNCSRCFFAKYCPTQPIAVITTHKWMICVRADQSLKIGCQDHYVDFWKERSDSRLMNMAEDSRFFQIWKPTLTALYEALTPKESDISHAATEETSQSNQGTQDT